MAEITVGESSYLVIKIPSKGDTNWAENLRLNAWTKIAYHDHTGGGKGAQITSGALADNSITSNKILDGAVVAGKLGADAVGSSNIADDAVSTEHIADNSINHLQIRDNAVRSNHILSAQITTTKINNFAVTHDKLATDAVENDNIKDATITQAKLSADTVTYLRNVATLSNTTEASAYVNSRADTVVVTSLSDVTITGNLDCTHLIVRGGGNVTIEGNVTGCLVQTVNDESVIVHGSIVGSVLNVGGNLSVRIDSPTYIDECQINAHRLHLYNNTDNTDSITITNSDIKLNRFGITSSYVIIESSTYMRGVTIDIGDKNVTLGGFATFIRQFSNVAWSIGNGVFKADFIFEAIPSASYTVASGDQNGSIGVGAVVVNTDNMYTVTNNAIRVPMDGVYSVQLMKDVLTTSTNTPATLRLMIEHSGGLTQDVGNMSHKPALGATIDASVFANVSMDVTLNQWDTIEGLWRYWGPGGTSNFEREKIIIKYLGSL